jgi:hypothetical protein
MRINIFNETISCMMWDHFLSNGFLLINYSVSVLNTSYVNFTWCFYPHINPGWTAIFYSKQKDDRYLWTIVCMCVCVCVCVWTCARTSGPRWINRRSLRDLNIPICIIMYNMSAFIFCVAAKAVVLYLVKGHASCNICITLPRKRLNAYKNRTSTFPRDFCY